MTFTRIIFVALVLTSSIGYTGEVIHKFNVPADIFILKHLFKEASTMCGDKSKIKEELFDCKRVNNKMRCNVTITCEE